MITTFIDFEVDVITTFIALQPLRKLWNVSFQCVKIKMIFVFSNINNHNSKWKTYQDCYPLIIEKIILSVSNDNCLEFARPFNDENCIIGSRSGK
jgi:hypothetical protein